MLFVGFSGIRDFRMMTPSGRRSTAISRSSHSILRKAGFVKTAAAFPLMSSPNFHYLAVSGGPFLRRAFQRLI